MKRILFVEDDLSLIHGLSFAMKKQGYEFESMDQFKAELVDYLDYYNNQRIKLKLGGLPPAVHRHQALVVS